MPLSRVSKRYQITIPKEIREKLKIEQGDNVVLEYGDDNTVKLIPPTRRHRRTWKFGSKLTVKQIGESIEVGKAKRC